MAETTIVPFSSLPTCAVSCGPLYDANGACVPPAASTAALSNYAACFCADSRVSALSTATTGVCEANVCTAAGDTGALESIHEWFTSFCSENAVVTTSTGSATATSTGSSGTKKPSDSNYSWVSSHWRWIVFIVVVVVGIAVIWIGACIWRRKYLRKKDRQYELSKSLARQSNGGVSGPPLEHGATQTQPGVFAPANTDINAAYEAEKRRSKLGSRRQRN